MAPKESISGYQGRRAIYQLDDRAIDLVKQTWPVISGHLEQVIDKFLMESRGVSLMADAVARNSSALKKLEMTHFESLLSGDLGEHYADLCRKTVNDEAAMGLDGRIRSSAGNHVLRAAIKAISRKYRFYPDKIAERCCVMSQVIGFDIANAMTLHMEAAETAAQTRRRFIDGAIADFSRAIEDAVRAMHAAASYLSMTCSEMKEIADETCESMGSASRASDKVTEQMTATVTATDGLSAQIDEIGQRTTAGLNSARSAVDRTQDAAKTTQSLKDAAERVGSIVGLISKIASQTNLLALNATIEAARAGSAGKGFAVVASEVKELAGQTTRATEDVARQVAAIQDATKHSVKEILSIAQLMDDLTSVSIGIAAAVEEQTVTAREIASSIQVAARNSAQASQQIFAIDDFANRSRENIAEITKWGDRLSFCTSDLEMKVSVFFSSVRSA